MRHPIPLLVLSWAFCSSLGVGCSPSPIDQSPPSLRFLRDAVLVPGAEEGPQVVEREWNAGETITMDGYTATAPRHPECVPLFQVPLGDVSRVVSMGGTAPDTALAWSPDERLLAVGSYRGEVVVVDGTDGTILARRRLAETMVKQVAWAADGQTLYATEQSPDAFLHALDPEHLGSRWTVRLADEVGSSPAPDGQDVFGVYTLPTAYQLAVLEAGDLLVGAAHGWTDKHGVRQNLSRLLRFGPDGTVRAAWPSQALDATLMHFAIDEAGDMLAVVVGRTAHGEAPPGLPIGGLQLLSLEQLTPLRALPIAPLPPHFKSTFIWEAVGLSVANDLVIAGMGDGRLIAQDLAGKPKWQVDLGTPLSSSTAPISASIGFGLLRGDQFVVHTSGTNVPYGSSSPAARPPSPHPGDNTLSVYDVSGALQWAHRGIEQLNGLVMGADGRTLVVGTTARPDDGREDLFGAALFDLDREQAGTKERIVTCRTEGPVFFRPSLSSDGRLALAEHPYRRADGTLSGTYQVTVMR
ncbi:MAG: hypothetical protein CL928_16800 [Deltaproteobacteria bacterium]|nr:hypothetical protein [Deltaproteobacteria bacterium]